MLRYAFAIFVSAFLLFQVQPLIGRFALPWFGGGPSLWTTCMLFFQVVLLLGYGYAHLVSTKLSVRAQVVTHIGMLALSLLFLPITPDDSWKPVADRSPAWQILLLLLATVGGPYFMLSTTGPLLQRWFNWTSPGQSPYRLYALSNVGSLSALLSYPIVFEPWMQLRRQASNWTIAYVLYVLLAAWCAIQLWRARVGEPSSQSARSIATDESTEAQARSPRWWQMLLWLSLSACGSAMLLATTNQLCIDVATVPFLWILPLSIYLLTFILCFDSPRWYDRRIFGALLFLAAPAACWVLSSGVETPLLDQVVIYSTVLFACCMTCHGELVQSRPPARYLTLFFMLVSAGGALGGLFVAIVATRFFMGYWEFHIALAASVFVTIQAWCYQRVWRGRLVPAFWIGMIAVGLQLGLVWYFAYKPYVAIIADEHRIIIFGVYALIQIVGLGITSALQTKFRIIPWVWISLAAIQLAWLSFSFQYFYPYLVGQNTALKMVLGSIIPALLSVLAMWWINPRSQRTQAISTRALILVAISLLLAACWYFSYFEQWQIYAMIAVFVFATVSELAFAKFFKVSAEKSWGLWFWIPAEALLVLLSLQLVKIVREDGYDSVHVSRNFYGVLRVRLEKSDEYEFDDPRARYSLTHGQIMHGIQFTSGVLKHEPTSYYGRLSGIGLAIRLSENMAQSTDRPSLRVGVVGLGTGSIAAYGRAGDQYRFYEINPDVQALSGKYFTYLTDSPAETQVVLGDARITLERELAANQSQQFDVLAIDAFSSDSIPVHLLTTECGEIYRQHLRPGGILAVHISNRFLDLNPVARGLADHLGWNVFRVENEDDDSLGVSSSTWILLTSSEVIAQNPELQHRHMDWEKEEKKIQWTDDYSGLWPILSF